MNTDPHHQAHCLRLSWPAAVAALSLSLAVHALAAGQGAGTAPAAKPKIGPARDLIVEVRQTVAAPDAAVSYRAGADGTQGNALQQQMVLVRNGEKASIRMGTSVPMVWVEAAYLQSPQAGSLQNAVGGSASSSTNSGPSANADGPLAANGMAGGVRNSVQWFDAGQAFSVQPRWPGGNQAVTLELELQVSSMQASSASPLPSQERSTWTTTVTAALAQWVTVASTGALRENATYSSDAHAQQVQLLQIRVLAP